MRSEEVSRKIESLRSMSGVRSTRPDLRVDIAVQEAFNLFEWCKHDREMLIKKGLDWSLVDDLRTRALTLEELHSAMKVNHNNLNEIREKWKEEFMNARNFRNELVHDFYFAFHSVPQLTKKVRKITKSRRIPEIIQSFANLSKLGSKYQHLLLKKDFDIGLLEKAWDLARILPGMYSVAKSTKSEGREATELRNKAFYHLHEAVKEIRRTGKYVFWEKKKRYKGYISDYMTVKARKIKRRKAQKDEDKRQKTKDKS